jgi:hypothetical protein
MLAIWFRKDGRVVQRPKLLSCKALWWRLCQ